MNWPPRLPEYRAPVGAELTDLQTKSSVQKYFERLSSVPVGKSRQSGFTQRAPEERWKR